jgi:hypothetical protein
MEALDRDHLLEDLMEALMEALDQDHPLVGLLEA